MTEEIEGQGEERRKVGREKEVREGGEERAQRGREVERKLRNCGEGGREGRKVRKKGGTDNNGPRLGARVQGTLQLRTLYSPSSLLPVFLEPLQTACQRHPCPLH